MNQPVTLCLTCANLRGCSLLLNSAGFDASKVITEENPRLCESWVELSDAAKAGRVAAFRVGRLASLQTIHAMEEEGEMDVVPDFGAMIRAGMTASERAAQLRFETDEAGTLLTNEDGQNVIRSAFPLRKYASDENGPVKKSNRTVMFMPPDQLIDLIVKAEVEAGLVVKETGTKKKATPSKAVATERKDKEMAEAKKITLRKPVSGGATAGGKTASAPATNGTTKIASPATGKKKVATSGGGGGGAAKEESNGKTSVPAKATETKTAAPSVDITKALAPLMKKLEAIETGLNELKEGLEAVQTKNTEGLTILHDVFMQRINDLFMRQIALAQGEEIEVPESKDENSLLEDGNDIFWYVEGSGEEGGDGEAEAGNE